MEQATVADGVTPEPVAAERSLAILVERGHLHPDQRGKGPQRELGLLEPGQPADVDRFGPRLAPRLEPAGEGLAVVGVGAIGQRRLDEDLGPLAREDRRGHPVGHGRHAALRVHGEGVLVLVGVPDVFGESEDPRLKRHGCFLSGPLC